MELNKKNYRQISVLVVEIVCGVPMLFVCRDGMRHAKVVCVFVCVFVYSVHAYSKMTAASVEAQSWQTSAAQAPAEPKLVNLLKSRAGRKTKLAPPSQKATVIRRTVHRLAGMSVVLRAVKI